MKWKVKLEEQIRDWFPEESSLPHLQRLNAFERSVRFRFLRLTYGVVLSALLVVPFGVYHSKVEPYVVGSLWGCQLPVGYVGLLLGLLMVFYPRLNILRRFKFSSLMLLAGIALFLSFIFFPKDYSINLLHGTGFSPSQIDVDYQVGNLAVLGLSLLSIAYSSVSFALLCHRYSNR
jgi:hypothetical protein